MSVYLSIYYKSCILIYDDGLSVVNHIVFIYDNIKILSSWLRAS